MTSTRQFLHTEASLSRRASGALSLQDDYDRTRVGSVEIAFWTDAAQGSGGITVMHSADTRAKHFAFPAAVIASLLAVVFRPTPEPND